MSARDRRLQRQKLYTLVSAGLMMIFLVISLAAFLHVGSSELERVYDDPQAVFEALQRAQSRFRRQDLDGDNRRDYAESLRELAAQDNISELLARAQIKGYRYRIESADAQGYTLSATPAEVTSGSLFLFTDQSTVIYGALGQPASVESEVFWHPREGLVWPHPLPPRQRRDPDE